jgi:ATP-binding protein involved in chromosome partitioning
VNNTDALVSLLAQLKDPFLDLTAQEMGLEYTHQFDATSLDLELMAGFPTALLEETYAPLLKDALHALFPNFNIRLHVKAVIRAHKTQLLGKGLRGVKNTIAVASGKGGVGKSTIAVNLAAALARLGARVGILDADIYGPSLPLMLGQTKPIELSGESYLPVQAHGLQAMSIGYLTDADSALIWRGPMLAKSLIQMLDITLWDSLDYLFIDLPPGTGDIQLTLVQKIPLSAAIVVTTPQNVATLDAQKALNLFEKTQIDVLGIVENMSTHLCSQCGHEEAIFGSEGARTLCAKHKTPLLGQLPLHSQIRKQSDEGVPIALEHNELAHGFLKTALHAAIELAKRPINYADKFPKIVVE